MAATAVLFPGQGSLTPDAGDRARALCPDLVDEAVTLVGEDPFARAHESTRFAQPATFLASMAGWVEARPRLDGIVAMAGHSLGELAALAAAGVLSSRDALELVVLRGHLMADAAAGEGGMTALLGADVRDVVALADRYGACVANDNAPGQIVLSGPLAAMEAAGREARSRGLRAIPLDVAGAFHSPAMAPVVGPFRAAIGRTPLSPEAALAPVISGLTALPFSDVPAELSRAVIAPVRWREVMTTLVSLGAEEFVDVGPGRVLGRLVARNVGGARAAVA